MIKDIKKINEKLHNKFYKHNIEYNCDSIDFNKEYIQPIIKFINEEISELKIKQFDYLDEINDWFTDIEDLKNFIKFCEVDYMSDTTGCFIVKEEHCEFIEPEQFKEYIDTLIYVAEYEDTIKWNSFLMKKVFKIKN